MPSCDAELTSSTKDHQVAADEESSTAGRASSEDQPSDEAAGEKAIGAVGRTLVRVRFCCCSVASAFLKEVRGETDRPSRS